MLLILMLEIRESYRQTERNRETMRGGDRKIERNGEREKETEKEGEREDVLLNHCLTRLMVTYLMGPWTATIFVVCSCCGVKEKERGGEEGDTLMRSLVVLFGIHL